ncbi:MAG TPA: hypothetical protein VMV53_09710 [Acidimicrobiales bacterium]|nr:hypothetical protein [Acidimicrobiales bacterium]
MDQVDKSPDNCGLDGRGGQYRHDTQIHEGTNQVQGVVVAKHLLK